jgi:hypothetical protein
MNEINVNYDILSVASYPGYSHVLNIAHRKAGSGLDTIEATTQKTWERPGYEAILNAHTQYACSHIPIPV